MSNAPKVLVKGQPIDDAVTVFVNGSIYSGWEDVQITRELNTVAGDFQLKLTDKWKPEKMSWSIHAGDAVHIHMGKHSILTGWIDSISPSFSATSRSIIVKGRSKSCDLVDCSVTGLNQFRDVTLQVLAQKLCEPFKVPVYFKTSAGEPFSSPTVKQGETVFAFLDRHARQRKLIMVPNYDGGLEFIKVGGVRSKTKLAQGVNVLSGSSNSDQSNRFSEYIVKGQNLSFKGDDVDQMAGPEGRCTDSGVARFRPLVIINNAASDDVVTTNRAQYEANIRAAKSLEADVEVQGWYKEDGSLWEVNEEVFCDVGFLGLRRWMLVNKVTFNKNASGTTTSISLIRKDAYDFSSPDKRVKKEDDLSWLKTEGYTKPADFWKRQETNQ